MGADRRSAGGCQAHARALKGAPGLHVLHEARGLSGTEVPALPALLDGTHVAGRGSPGQWVDRKSGAQRAAVSLQARAGHRGRPGPNATWVTARAVSQSARSSSPRVFVETVRCSYVTVVPDAMRTHATTVLAWTSKPAQRGYRTSISRLPSCAAQAWSPRMWNLEGALSGDHAGVAIRGAHGTLGQTNTRAGCTNAEPTSEPVPHDTVPRFMPTWVRR